MKIEEGEKVDEENQEKMTSVDQEQRELQRADRAKSTSEVAKDLERAPAGRKDRSATTALFPENESQDFHKRWNWTRAPAAACE